jgi:hypothetical protein
MTKYYFFLVLVLGAVLFYIFTQDPCNQLLRADFSNKNPEYKILDSGSGEGSPDNVQCHIIYQKPDSEKIYEDTWVYKNSGSGWIFASILETQEREQAP